MKKFIGFVLCALAFTVGRCSAQSVSNLYSAGVSYSAGASQSLSGTALYAHAVSPDTTGGNMYAFTVIDAVPATSNPFTVTTNIGVGVAQKVATIAGVPIFVPTSAGLSLTGSNAGWAWTTGAAVPFKLKGNWYVIPTVRLLKSSVSNGAGYQPIVGLLFGWGQ